MFEEVERAQAMRDAGATSYASKSGAAEELVQTIRTCVQASERTREASQKGSVETSD
jgi:hypothetical protein